MHHIIKPDGRIEQYFMAQKCFDIRITFRPIFRLNLNCKKNNEKDFKQSLYYYFLVMSNTNRTNIIRSYLKVFYSEYRIAKLFP